MAKKTTARKPRTSKTKTDRISADKAAPASKQAAHQAFPETADPGWAAGNPEQAKALGS